MKQEAAALYPQLVAWRRDFHAHPELGFQEVRTAGIVTEHLRELGLEVNTGIGKTGVVALLEGETADPERPDDPAALRHGRPAHSRETGLPFSSQNRGRYARLRT